MIGNFFDPQPHADAAENVAYFKERGWETEPLGFSFSLHIAGEGARMIWWRWDDANAVGMWEVSYFSKWWRNLTVPFGTAKQAYVYAEIAGWNW